MATDELKAHATSSTDFYGLLEISPAAAENEIRRAYRRAALKYHPDKISKPTQADLDKFHLLQIANDVLSDPAVRQLYDNAREARERKRKEVEMMDAAKRKMKEDLEARERAGDQQQPRGMKRAWMATAGVDNDAEEKLEREIQRIAEDTRRRRREAEEKLMREVEEEERMEQEARKKQEAERDRAGQYVDRSKEGGTNVPELDRAVKVRWIREGPGDDLNKERLIAMFATFGRVENVIMLKDKRQRVGNKREKKMVATGVVVFYSIVNAHAAVLDSEKKRRSGEGDWAVVESVYWASGQEPSIGHAPTGNAAEDAAAATSTTTNTTTKAPVPPSQPSFNFAGLKDRGAPPKSSGKPSFGSFSTANAKRETPSVAGDKPALTTASLQEVTLMRLKNAQREKERKALEEKLRREDEAADAAASLQS